MLVGYQFSRVDQTTKLSSQSNKRFPLMCILKPLKPKIQESANLGFFPHPRKLISTNLSTFTVNYNPNPSLISGMEQFQTDPFYFTQFYHLIISKMLVSEALFRFLSPSNHQINPNLYFLVWYLVV